MIDSNINKDESAFIKEGLSLVSQSMDSNLCRLYFNKAEARGIVIKCDSNPDYVINGIKYKLIK